MAQTASGPRENIRAAGRGQSVDQELWIRERRVVRADLTRWPASISISATSEVIATKRRAETAGEGVPIAFRLDWDKVAKRSSRSSMVIAGSLWARASST